MNRDIILGYLLIGIPLGLALFGIIMAMKG
jgi:hypothetical protein